MDARLYRQVRRSLTGLLVGAFLAARRMGVAPRLGPPGRGGSGRTAPGTRRHAPRVRRAGPARDDLHLKPGQTPNVDRLAPVVDFSSADDFGGFADNFVSQVTGNVHVAAAAPTPSG